MTNEKAIKILSSYKNSYFGDALHGGVISVSEIIELLSAQPEPPVSSAQSHENDLISRQAAIDLFPNDALEWDTKGGYVAPHLARRMIEELPFVQTEPCEDAVSREDAIDTLDDEITITGKSNAYVVMDYVQRVKRKLENLPSVTPKPKTGKWEIYVISPFDGEGCRCSECKYEGAPYWDYCPNCGADMRERREK